MHITARPGNADTHAQNGRDLFSAIATLLRQHQAAIFQERIFAPADAISDWRTMRTKIYGDLADGVEPNWLLSGADDLIGGAQVHAIAGLHRTRVLKLDGIARGRFLESDNGRWISASGLSAPHAGDAASQAKAIFLQAESLLHQTGADLRSVARTWIFMDRILDWYSQLNQVRTTFFAERGLIGRGTDENRMPASTGIGISPASGAKCAMDLVAVSGRENLLQRYHAAGKQRSAYEYGSAFARAAQALTPAGTTVYVSGTAAIDEHGRTCHVGDAAGQVQMTLENVTAVLRQMDCSPHDVVQAMAYCANRQVQRLFDECWAPTLPWPWITLIGDVCRPDLLFEVEVMACPGAKRM